MEGPNLSLLICEMHPSGGWWWGASEVVDNTSIPWGQLLVAFFFFWIAKVKVLYWAHAFPFLLVYISKGGNCWVKWQFCLGTADPLHEVAVPFYSPNSREQNSDFSTSLPTLVIICLLIMAPPIGYEGYLTVVLDGIAVMVNEMLSNFSRASWPSVFLLFKWNVCSEFLPMFKLDHLSFYSLWGLWKPQCFYLEQLV